jgi:hypothetical protein
MEIARHVILSFEPTADLSALNDASVFAAYQSVLHGKKALLFFDNARSVEQIAQLRPPDSCSMLVTSRWTFTIPGLQSRRVGTMIDKDAQAFLLELCQRVGNKVPELAKACAYLPLALRIAGSFLRVNNNWSIDNYLVQITNRKQRLATLKDSREESELTSEPDLLATLELSYKQLSKENQKRWHMLSVFPISFDATAAAVMWELEAKKTVELLDLLRRYSLLEYDENSSRYSLHDLLADYALLQMEDREERAARLRHASFYMAVMEYSDYLYLEGGSKLLQGLLLFDTEWENIKWARQWAVANMSISTEVATLCNYTMQVHCLDLRLHHRVGLGNTLYNLGLAYYNLEEKDNAVNLVKQALEIYRTIESPNVKRAQKTLREWGVLE